MVPPVGIEPTTRGFSVPCSTNWATEANWRPDGDSNPGPPPWQGGVLTNWTTRPFLSEHLSVRFLVIGGNNRARTYDPLLVRQMLSQLSYASIPFVSLCRSLALRRLRLYHKSSVLSIPFLNFFEKFFKVFLWPLDLCFSLAQCLCIISPFFLNCNTFF